MIIVLMATMLSMVALSKNMIDQKKPVFSEDVLKAIEKVKHAIEDPNKNRGYEAEKLEMQYKKYDDAVRKLGRLVTSEHAIIIQNLKEIEINQAIAVMAYNVTTKPEQLAELFRYYNTEGVIILDLDEEEKKAIVSLPDEFKPWNDPSIEIHGGPDPAPLNPKHCVEKYRSAWEYLMLAPKNKKVKFINYGDESYSLNAMRVINNLHSTSLLSYAFSITYNSPLFDSYFDDLALLDITYFATAQSLEYILGGLAECTQRKARKFKKNIPEKLILAMSGSFNSSGKIKRDPQKWKEVITAYPKDNLPQWQKDFLNDVLKAIDKQEKIETERKTEKKK